MLEGGWESVAANVPATEAKFGKLAWAAATDLDS